MQPFPIILDETHLVQLRESSTCLVIIFCRRLFQRLKLSSCCSCQSRDLEMWHWRNTADYATQCHTAAPVMLIMWDPHPLVLPRLIAAQPSRFHRAVKLGVNSESIQDMPKQSCKARTNPRHPLAIPEDRPALTRPCCPASGATPISRNVSISGTACGHILPLIINARGRQKRQSGVVGRGGQTDRVGESAKLSGEGGMQRLAVRECEWQVW